MATVHLLVPERACKGIYWRVLGLYVFMMIRRTHFALKIMR